jgi:hypothetical protein
MSGMIDLLVGSVGTCNLSIVCTPILNDYRNCQLIASRHRAGRCGCLIPNQRVTTFAPHVAAQCQCRSNATRPAAPIHAPDIP